MKRQNFKAPLVISGLFLCTVLAAMMTLFFQMTPEAAWLKPFKSRVVEEIPPLRGHWLMTADDRGYSPPSLDIKKKINHVSRTGYQGPGIIRLEEARTRLNRQLDSINILYIWTDEDKLRVISVTSFNKKTKQAAVVVLPLSTVVNNTNAVNPENSYMTIKDLYKEKGRAGLQEFIEKKFEIKVPNFVHVNQTALQKISNIVGVMKVNGDKITMLEAFEQTEAGIRTDDRDVVRAVADRILRPRMVLEVPELLWIFTHDIDTNFSTDQMVSLFNFSRRMDLKNMRKTALPGQEYMSETAKYLFVSEQTWKNIIYEITS